MALPLPNVAHRHEWFNQMIAKKTQLDKVKIPQWQFRKMQPGEMNIDPIEGEFFTTEAIGSITDGLVRESIQNSLDASSGEGAVKVCFSFFPGPEKEPNEVRSLYFDGLRPHFEARHSGLQDLPSAGADLNYILIEDFGTRGLQGDIRQYEDLEDDPERNDFYFFWRNIGRTRKESTDLGRWGLGKTVFQAASRINTFFGLTVRKDDGRKLLMGQCVLRIHKIRGERYSPYGYFGLFDQDLALPLEDSGYIERFSRCFAVDRSNQPGLSILIPYPDEDIRPKECLKSVIKHYFFPILSGRLIVVLRFSQKRYLLNAVSLDKLLNRRSFIESLDFRGVLDLAGWAIQQPEESYVRLERPEPGRAPKLREELFHEGSLEKARQDFNENKRLAFYLPVSIQQSHRKDFMHTVFSVFLERDDSLTRPEDCFIRQGITIPEVTSLKHKGIRALVSIADPALSTFLGDAENPAHTEWERNSKKFKRKYRLGPSTLDFVKSSPREIVKILTRPKKGRDETLLKHLFALPAEPVERPGKDAVKEKGSGDDRKSDGIFIGVEGSSYLRLSAVKGGFRLMRRAKSIKIPRFITVWMAYEVRSGSPFKKYTPLDFDVSQKPIQIKLHGGKLLVCRENTIMMEVLRADFTLAVVGFDPHRDLRVKTNP